MSTEPEGPAKLIEEVRATSDGVQVTYIQGRVFKVVFVPHEGLPLSGPDGGPGDLRRDEVRCAVLEAAGRCIIPG
jgi:hypothetical protein